jgi:hypothetical protein
MSKKENMGENIEIIEQYKELNEQCDIILEKIKKKHKKKAAIKQS